MKIMIFDSDVTYDIEKLGYSVELDPESGAKVRFVKGAHKIELYFEDGEWFVFSESKERKKSEEGYMYNESVGLSKNELDVIDDIIAKAELRMFANGG